MVNPEETQVWFSNLLETFPLPSALKNWPCLIRISILLQTLGSTYDISNKHRLGYSEVQLVQTMIDGVNALYAEDLELQQKHGL